MKVFITGGCGFIGSNAARHCLDRGDEVTVFDNLSRPGVEANLAWLKNGPGAERLRFVKADVRDADAVARALDPATGAVFQFAGQVAVTMSVADPRNDFECNALGSFNTLEAVRRVAPRAVYIYASTNKVYGGMTGLRIEETPTRYRYIDYPDGINEEQPLDFHSPYGCSKGAGDQYTRDYARIYGLRTVVFRQSCIYGTRQFGMEDQGWLAHLCIAAWRGDPITIYGDGKQVRDILWIDDLLAAYDRVLERIDTCAGEIFNIGGGPDKTVSVWRDLQPRIEAWLGRRVHAAMRDWRPGDQRLYVSDIRKARRLLDWSPAVGTDDGFRRMTSWVEENQAIFGPKAIEERAKK